MSETLFRVAIIGRPNVGKSTLFNRLAGKKLALVDNQPGVTRDLRESKVRLGDLRFTIIDTAGLENETGDSLPARMRRLTEQAIESADLSLFVFDARIGVTALDELLAGILRKSDRNVIVVANKSEGHAGVSGTAEAYRLNFGEPVALSAEHGEGIEDLYRRIKDWHDEHAENITAEPEEQIDRPIQISIIGRPNAGKSTLINSILGQDRLLTGPEAGITRDAIGLEVDWDGDVFKIFDTAGLRKRPKVQEKLEKLSTSDGLNAVRFSDVVVILMDVHSAFDQQDLRLASLAEREGRAVVIAVNKWDLEDNKQSKLAELKEKLNRLLPQLRGVPFVALSGQYKTNLDRLKSAIVSAHDTWNKRIPTALLNEWLSFQITSNPPPTVSGKRLKLRYITQAKTRPPTFIVFCTRADKIPDSYQRFLINGLREDFELQGTPIRLLLRQQKNPYDNKS
jgi:GTP-binding protein